MSRGPIPSAFNPSTSSCSETPSLHHRKLLAVFLHADARAGHHHRRPSARAARLADLPALRRSSP